MSDDISKNSNMKLFLKDCNFILGVRDYTKIPNFNLPEIAFWGRSNVGKSSLINALLSRKNLVKVSSIPGKTREINFFNLNKELIITDLPGYGYASVSKDIQKQWHYNVLSYITLRVYLRRIYLLIDSRIGFKELDLEIMNYLNKLGKAYTIVLTKIDKIKVLELETLKANIEHQLTKHLAAYPKVITTSIKNNMTLNNLKQSILETML